MGPIKAFQLGRMDILIGVGVLVMMPMLGRPPERTLLRGGAPKKGEAKLEKSTGFIASMREITMKSSRDAEFADKEHEGTERHGLQIHSSPKHGETREMNHDKKNTGKSNIKAARHTYLMGKGIQ
jgi:hypothetical protein